MQFTKYFVTIRALMYSTTLQLINMVMQLCTVIRLFERKLGRKQVGQNTQEKEGQWHQEQEWEHNLVKSNQIYTRMQFVLWDFYFSSASTFRSKTLLQVLFLSKQSTPLIHRALSKSRRKLLSCYWTAVCNIQVVTSPAEYWRASSGTGRLSRCSTRSVINNC